jgi:hypothetical protein
MTKHTATRAFAALGASVAALALALPVLAAPATAATRPQARILGFSTFPRLGVPAIQAKPGKTLTACYTRPPDNRDVSFVWSARGIPRGTKVGLAMWADASSRTGMAEPTIAEVMRRGFRWKLRASQSKTDAYGFTFGSSGFGPQNIDGVWTAEVVVAGRVLVKKSVTVACA